MRRRRCHGVPLVALLPLIGALLPSISRGQADVLPGSERPEIRPFEPEAEPPKALDLPPLPEVEREEGEPISAGLRVFVKAFHVEGSSVFSAEELEALTAPYSGRAIGSEDLLRARDAVTRHYIDHGYLTSGAYVPDQEPTDGVVVIRVVEGTLAAVQVEGTRRFREGYFRTRLRWAAQTPVDVNQIEAQLQRFHRDPHVSRVNAQLLPGERRGESILLVTVDENPFYALDLSFANDNSPGVGSYTGHARPRVSNLIGYGDEWSSELQFSEGLRQYDATFTIPIPPFDTQLALHYQHSRSDIVEEPFDVLDIESGSDTYGIALSQPLLRSRNSDVRVGLSAEWRTSETSLLGRCFSFTFGTDECEADLSVLRPFAGWTWATPSFVVAARSTLSVGIDALGSTQRPSPLPDSEFVSWLGQAQWAYRLPEAWWSPELVARFDVQLASDPLVAIEKFSVGGMRTVRGYRENQYVRDNGLVASVELRIPIWLARDGRTLAQLAPFFDYGGSWEEELTTRKQEIASVGVGIRLSPWDWLHAELYWGGRLKRAPKTGEDLQNDGIHFAIYATPF